MPSAFHATHRPIVLILLIVSLNLAHPSPVYTQDAEEDSRSLIQVPKLGTNPLAVVTLTSLERAREKLEVLCTIAGHPETASNIMSAIDNATNTLAGVDQLRPDGVAVYLNSIFPPSFEFVAFIPLTDTDAFLRTLELGPVVFNPVIGEVGRYELLGPTQTTQVRVENGYAFIQLPVMEPDEEFKRQLFVPVSSLKGKFDQFDISMTVDVESVPRVTRSLLLSFLTSTMSTQMQQRDEEADGVYEMRRAWMQADIDGFKLLMDECQRITIGLTVDEEQHLAIVDLLMDVRKDSDLINEIFDSARKSSYFEPILDDNAAVSLALSQIIPDRDRERYAGVLEGFKKELARQVTLKDLGPELDEASPVLAGLTALQETFIEGHLDAFGQCYDDSRGNLVVVGAVRVLEGETVAAGLTDILNRLQGMEGLESLQIGCEDHAGIQFHRIGFGDSGPGRNAVLGPNSGIVFGSGPRSMWFGVGGDETMDIVSSVMDQLQAAYEKPSQSVNSSIMRIVININQLIQLWETVGQAQIKNAKARHAEGGEGAPLVETGESRFDDDRNGKANPKVEAEGRDRVRNQLHTRQTSWRKTFSEGGDQIRADVQPTRSGVRMRIEFGEAFLKGFGRAITRRAQNSDN